MLETLFSLTLERVLLVIFSTAGVFLTVITYTRIAGLRSFSTMSGFDFAMTVAIGSLIATVAITQSSLIDGMIALAVLYLLQVGIAFLRRMTLFKKIIDNTPILLIHNGKILKENMRQARLTEDDIMSKLRSANVSQLQSVHAMVLETTGDISVLFGPDTPDPSLLKGVSKGRVK